MKKIFVGLFLLLSACATENPLKKMDNYRTTSSGDYTMAYWYKIKETKQPLKIYIEGDGQAFDEKGNLIDAPNPPNLLLSKLAVEDTSPNVVYLARPCLYIKGSCSADDWTTGKFSSKIIDAMNDSVNYLKKKAKTDKVILIGYSDGGMIASQIAAKQPKSVQKLITVAGVLDKDKWTTLHNQEALKQSKNLNIKSLKKVDQVHYVGQKDESVPPDLMYDILGKDNESVVVVKGATHTKGFDKIYKDIWQER